MKVLAYDPFVAAERFRELGVEKRETLDEVLARADFLTLHLPLTAETRASIDDAAIAKMRDGVRIVNAARGDLIDDAALIRGLESGKVAGAALDVFVEEPYSGPLLTAPNVVLTPHLAASTEEAQDRAGVIVAEQVVAALQGGLVTYAVNIPTIGAEDLEVLAPFVPLAAKLGRLAMELATSEVRRLQLDYSGDLSAYDTRLLTVAALNGAFEGRTDQPVNYVNAPLVAAERGVEVVEGKRSSSRDYRNLVQVAADGATVAGTTIGRENRQWLVEALGYQLEIELAPKMALLLYDDVPGVIGRIGTLFGGAGVNIANMAVSRNREGGKALMALSLDSSVPEELIHALRETSDDGFRRPVTIAGMAEWPEPVERVAGVLRSAGVEARIEELPHGTPTARAAADALGCELGQIVKSVVMVCDGAYVLALVPGDRRAGEAAVAAPSGRRARASRGPRRSSRRPASSPAASRRFRIGPSPTCSSTTRCSGQTAVWIGAGTTDHMAVLTSVDLQRLAKARLVDLTPPG